MGHFSFQTEPAILWAGRAVLRDDCTLPEILVQDEPLHRRVAFQQVGLRDAWFLFLGKETEAPQGGRSVRSSCRTEQLLRPLLSCSMLVHRFLWVHTSRLRQDKGRGRKGWTSMLRGYLESHPPSIPRKGKYLSKSIQACWGQKSRQTTGLRQRSSSNRKQKECPISVR